MNTSLMNLADVATILPKLLENLNVTLRISILSLIVGLLIGLGLTLLQERKRSIVIRITHYYVDMMRGAPLALLILLFFYGGKLILTATHSTIQIADEVFAILAISLSISCYFSEMMRSAYSAVDAGQKEAIQSVNIPAGIGFIRIIFPQCLILAIPNFGNLMINIVKMTSLVNIIGITDIFGRAEKISQNSYGLKQIPAFVCVIIVYWVLNLAILLITKTIEKKYKFLLN
jgi:L-cystine transport system permease protein